MSANTDSMADKGCCTHSKPEESFDRRDISFWAALFSSCLTTSTFSCHAATGKENSRENRQDGSVDLSNGIRCGWWLTLSRQANVHTGIVMGFASLLAFLSLLFGQSVPCRIVEGRGNNEGCDGDMEAMVNRGKKAIDLFAVLQVFFHP